jgi:hypothetical protein
VNPYFLFGRAEADDQAGGARRVDSLDRLRDFLVVIYKIE